MSKPKLSKAFKSAMSIMSRGGPESPFVADVENAVRNAKFTPVDSDSPADYMQVGSFVQLSDGRIFCVTENGAIYMNFKEHGKSIGYMQNKVLAEKPVSKVLWPQKKFLRPPTLETAYQSPNPYPTDTEIKE